MADSRSSVAQAQETSSATHMAMPHTLSAQTVEETAASMLEQQLHTYRHVTLDFSQVEILTSAGVQLVIALERTLSESSATLVIREVKSAIAEVFSDLGFERLLRTAS